MASQTVAFKCDADRNILFANDDFEIATIADAEWAKIATYEDVYNKQKAAKGEAQQASRDQNKAMRELKVWLLSFYRMAKVALKDRPDMQEEVGMLARSDGFKPRKKKPKPGNNADKE